MKQKALVIFTGTMVFILLLFVGRYGFTVVPIDHFQTGVFDPVVYVDEIWDTKIIPTFDDKAVELPKILSKITPDSNGFAPKEELIPIIKKYGVITVGESHAYMVKGNGRIVNVNIETSRGVAEMALDGYEGPIQVLLYIGPRLPGDDTSVRDAGEFIRFDDIQTATGFGEVAREINKRVLTTVLDGIDRERLAGKTVTFKGAFIFRTFSLTQIKVKEIRIVPVELEVSE